MRITKFVGKTCTEPFSIAIFGATGDLSQNKLLPAMFALYRKKLLPTTFSIVGFSRRQWTDVDFRKFVTELLVAKFAGSSAEVKKFVARCSYIQGDFSDLDSYKQVALKLGEIDLKNKACADKFLYLATPPTYYERILTNIKKSGLSVPCVGRAGWTRILIEKPFGRNLKESERLEKVLSEMYSEEQIFRIDHYLAKETMQNILTFRFSNALFGPVWDKNSIESVKIYLGESFGIGKRGPFYDGLGQLLDVGQNHVLQMLALVAMENPSDFKSDHLRANRAEVFKNLEFSSTSPMSRGQYEGYASESGVSAGSTAETYFFVKASLKSPRWKGVPFYLESGKKLAENKAEIIITFKPKLFCLPKPVCEHYRNRIVFRIQPNPGIDIIFWVKKEGLAQDLESKMFSFLHSDGNKGAPEAYEKVLFDSIIGDQSLFASTEEIRQSWKFIHKVEKALKKRPLHFYRPGSVPPTGESDNIDL